MNALLKSTLLVVLAAAVARTVCGEPPKEAPAKPVRARSVFVMPASSHEGRDPFFPESQRPYEEAVAATTNRPAPTLITVKGLSIDHGQAMVIINNHTFAIGDEGDVLTAGRRLHLRLVGLENGAAIVEINGSRRKLTIPPK